MAPSLALLAFPLLFMFFDQRRTGGNVLAWLSTRLGTIHLGKTENSCRKWRPEKSPGDCTLRQVERENRSAPDLL